MSNETLGIYKCIPVWHKTNKQYKLIHLCFALREFVIFFHTDNRTKQSRETADRLYTLNLPVG